MSVDKNVKVEYSHRRKRSLNRPRLMDGEKTINPDHLPAGTPVVIYVRVSSEEQVDGYSLSAQERFCREFAEKRAGGASIFTKTLGTQAKTIEGLVFRK